MLTTNLHPIQPGTVSLGHTAEPAPFGTRARDKGLRKAATTTPAQAPLLWGPVDLTGEWSGRNFCRGQPPLVITASIAQVPEGYRIVLGGWYRETLVMAHGKRGYGGLAPGGSLPFKKIVFEEGQPAYLQLGGDDSTGNECVGGLARFVPIPGLGGVYAEQRSYEDMCREVHRRWMGVVEQERPLAEALKVRFSEPLDNFFPSGINAAYMGDGFEQAFGMSADRMTRAQGLALSHQLGVCELLGPVAFPRKSSVALQRDLTAARRGVPLALGVDYAEEPLNESYIAVHARVVAAEQALSALVPEWRRATRAEDLLRALRENASVIVGARPSVATELMGPVAERLETLRKEGMSARVLSVPVPWARIPPAHHASVRLMLRAPFRFDAASMLFLSGMALEFGRDCEVGLDEADRYLVSAFIEAGLDRALFGGRFADPNPAAAADLTGGELVFHQGKKAAQDIGCDEASGFAPDFMGVLADAIRSNQTDGAGGDPPFVRTCSVEMSRSGCFCLARIGQAVEPNLYQETYSRERMAAVVRGSPLVAAKIARQCGISSF